MARVAEYHIKTEMRRLSEALFTLITLYTHDNPEIALASCKEARMLAALAGELKGGKQAGAIASSALLQLSHQKKIEAAVAKRRAVTLPLDELLSGGEKNITPMRVNGGGGE
jgi:hypothetical protein